MSVREVPLTHFPTLAPTLFADRTVLALVPATDDTTWAVQAAWTAARAAARGGRRVTLIDLGLAQPTLHAQARERTEEGIVDAFVFGVSLTHVARQQEPDLFFIATGTEPAHAEDVWGSDRWQRLARGFQHEGALLLLYLPPAALGRVKVSLDTIIVLAPEGYGPESGTFPAIAEQVARGTATFMVIRKAPTPAAPPARATPPPLSRRRPSTGARAPVRRRAQRRTLFLTGAAVVGFTVAAVWLLPDGSGGPTGLPAGLDASDQPSAHRNAAPPPNPGDSLFYSVQIAAFNALDPALAYARGFGADAGAATVSPVWLGHQGLWYRVLVGTLPTPAAADSLLRALWRDGSVERPSGTILRTPHAYALSTTATREAAGELVQGLRRKGIAAYIVAAPDGSARVLTGAFETTEQARAADTLLQLTGMTTSVVQRVGTRP